MSSSPSRNLPWPAPTPPPSKSHYPLDVPGPSPLPTRAFAKRQDTNISDSSAVDQARSNCQLYANNDNVTCYPTAGDQVFQHQWAAVVWNSRRPQLVQANLVDIYLCNGDTLQPLFSSLNVPNPTGTAGEINLPVNDSWFGDRGLTWAPGSNFSYPFYWIISNQDVLDGSQTTNPTFYAIQTTYLDAVASSMSQSYLSSLSTQSSLSAASASLASIASSASSTAASSGSIQLPSNNTAFPHWGIAVIVVLGFLAIVAGCVLVWLVMRRLRRQQERLTHRGSMGSSSPMMANVQSSNSPQLPLLAGAAGGGGGRASSEHHRPASIVSPDGVSEISRTHSAGDQGPFSGADAAIMADAFRKALRKPDFTGPIVDEPEERKDDTLINRELAEEGRDIRSVSSTRGYRVETLSDAGDTAQPH